MKVNMCKIKYCILLLLPVYLFSQGMYQDNSQFGIQTGGSWASSLDSKIKSNTATIEVSFQSRIDLGYSFAEISNKGSVNIKYNQAKAFSLTVYPIEGQTLVNSKFGISVQYIDYQSENESVVSGGLIGATEEKVSNSFSLIPILGVFINGHSKNMKEPFYSAIFDLAAKLKINEHLLFILEPGGSISTVSSSYSVSVGIIFLM